MWYWCGLCVGRRYAPMNLEWAECMGFVCVFIFGPLFGAGWFCFLVQPTACVNFREIPCWETKMVAWQPHWQEMFLYIIDCIYICLLKEKAFSVILKGQYKLWSQILPSPPPFLPSSPLLPPPNFVDNSWEEFENKTPLWLHVWYWEPQMKR